MYLTIRINNNHTEQLDILFTAINLLLALKPKKFNKNMKLQPVHLYNYKTIFCSPRRASETSAGHVRDRQHQYKRKRASLSLGQKCKHI